MRNQDILVFRAAVPQDGSRSPERELAPYLSTEEVETATRLPRLAVRNERLVSRALVRAALSACQSGVAPHEWEFETGEHGKPRVTAPTSDLRFNLTHSHGLAACAVSVGLELGLDVEDWARRHFDPGMGEGYLSRREIAALLACAEPDRQRKFFTFWTLKEAYLKAMGTGLGTPLESFAILEYPDNTYRISFGEGEPEADSPWELHSWEHGTSYLLALCVNRPPGTTIQVHAQGSPIPGWP